MFNSIIFFIRLFWESILQAIGQLIANKLRTILSLLGVTIGIWCIIMVLSAVHSLEANIRGSFEKLGDDVVYVSTMPWGEDPSENYWKYMRRPEPNYRDFKAIEAKVKNAEMVAFNVFIGAKRLEYRSSSVANVFLVGPTYSYRDIFNIEMGQGRYFTPAEYQYGSDQIILGYQVAQNLFPGNINPIGKEVKLAGRKMQVIGVIEKQGKDLLKPIPFDQLAMIPYPTSRKFVSTNRFKGRGTSIMIKASEGTSLEDLKTEVAGVLRAQRRLAPKEEDNFSLNNISIIANLISGVFKVVNIAGSAIGLFSLLVGGFGVANIMFVSVKERTSMIGIKKALGAKKIVILLEFLIESIVLCLLGGLIGLSLVWLAAQIATRMFDFTIVLSAADAGLGLSISAIIGIISGVFPAWQAANMDPVVAMRQ